MRRSVVDVVITYPTNSVVDMNDIKAKLEREVQSTVTPSGIVTGVPITEDPNMVQALQYKNAALFWGLIAVLIVILLIILIMALCFCCPGCYLYKKEYEQFSYNFLKHDLKKQSPGG